MGRQELPRSAVIPSPSVLPSPTVIPPRRRNAGFTLVELAIVTLIIAIVLALALPHFFPVLAFSELEGAARHLTGYGRAAMAHCAFARDRVTVCIDLTSQEYWTLRWPEVVQTTDENAQGKSERKSATTKLFKQQSDKSAGGSGKQEQSSYDETAQQAEDMQATFDQFARLSLMARARHVKHEGILKDIGPIFDKKFSLDIDDDKEKQREELQDPLLTRVVLPDSVWIESVLVGTSKQGKGVVEIEVTPLGLNDPVEIYLKNESGDYYTVVWDPITGGARCQRGKGSAA